MRTLLSKFLLLAFFTGLVSCGSEHKVEDSTHELKGNPTVTIDWGFDQFSEAFREDCQTKYDNGEINDVEQCVADKIVELINLIQQGLNDNSKKG